MTALTRAPEGVKPELSASGAGALRQSLVRLRDALARPRPVSLLSAELGGAALVVAALGAEVVLLVLWAAAMTVVHATGARYAETQPVRHGLHVGVVALPLCAVAGFYLGLPLDQAGTFVAVAGMSAATATVHAVRILARNRAGTSATRVVLVGPSGQLHHLLHDLSRPGGTDVDVVGICLTDEPSDLAATAAGLPTGVPVTTGGSSILPSVQVLDADAVLTLPWSGLAPAELRRLEWHLGHRGTELWISPGLTDTDPDRTSLLPAGSARLLRVRPSSMHGTRRILKDAAERIAAATALLVVSPLLLVLVGAIRLDGGGAAIFRQTRVGRSGSRFTMLKLRTMVPDAERMLETVAALNESDGALFKVREDPRITRVGRWLRRFSLDELPQLWNVVRGDMSLIGPRPPLPREVAEYAPDTFRRLDVKPGLTGLWQVSGRSDLSWEESERLDLKYVDNWSLRLDLLIAVRTLRAVVSRQGAY